MAILKEKTIEEIRVSDNGTVFYSELTTIKEDGVVIGKKSHVTTLTPSNDLPIAPENVLAICKLTWTKSVVDAYLASQQ